MTYKTQPEALRLADHLEQFRSFPDDLAAAAELRRLHTENEAKDDLLQQALDANAGATTPLEALAALGGYEVATMVGAVLEAAAQRRVIVVDGFITSAAVLVASRLAPHVLQRCVFAHCSGERGHRLMLAQMQAEPLLDLGLRLGEGSGAALAWPLLQSACAVLAEMASFESAGVATQVP